MTETQDFRVMHPGSTRLRVRADLRFLPQVCGQPYYLIEDLVRSKYYRIGLAEYTFISLLDGDTSVDEALSRAASISPMACFTEQDGLAICKWLLDNDLADTAATRRRRGEDNKTSRAEHWQRFNPIVLRIPLLRPDKWFDRFTPWMSWFFCPPMVLMWLMLIGLAGYRVGTRWESFWSTSGQVFAASNWFWLGVCWISLKVIHELAHGTVCKRYGGVVREAGAIFILLAPLAYVDVTCSWRFRDKWQRIFTATAGMYAETFVAALAALIWSCSPAGLMGQLAFNVTIMAGISTILFNANPLMRFDGYYILSDWLGIPNLYTSGQQYLQYLGRRYLLGMPATLPDWPTGVAAFIKFYGFAAFLWRIIICVGLIIVASALLQGAGVLLALAAVALWVGRPLWQFLRFLVRGSTGQQPDRIRFALVGGSLAIGVVALFLLPWCGATSAPALVTYAPLSVVRASSSGFVRDIRIADGQRVQAGQTLLVLENDELRLALQDLELQIMLSRVRARQHEQQDQQAARQAELVRQQALQQRCEELRGQVADLTIRADASGQVIAANIQRLLDTYVEEGDELLSIGDEQSKELQLSIAQEDVERFEAQRSEPVAVWVPGHGRLNCRLTELEPRARLEAPHPAFCASEGGPIAVERGQDEQKEQTYRFLAPRFVGTVALDARQSQLLRAGQFGIVSFAPADELVGQHLIRLAASWIRDRFQAAKKSRGQS